MSYTGFDYLQTGVVNSLLERRLELLADLLGGAAQGHLVGIRGIIRIAAHYVAQRGICLDRQEVLVIVNVEQRLRGICNAPDDYNSHLYGIAHLVVYLLLAVVVGHRLEGNLGARHSGLSAGLGLCGHGHAEYVDEEESFMLYGTDIFSEQGEYQGFIRLDYSQSDKRKPADTQPDYANYHFYIIHSEAVFVCVRGAVYDPEYGGNIQNDRDEQHRPAVGGIQFLFFVVHFFYGFHKSDLPDKYCCLISK